jgi:ethanolaminephosphotransferase
VTRHLPSVLAPSADWYALVLHYLGLDHIGHAYGAASPLIYGKLHEMDAVIEHVHTFFTHVCV